MDSITQRPEQLQTLYALIQTRKKPEHEFEEYWNYGGERLTIVESLSKNDDLLIHIDLDEQNPERFMYMALTNKFFANSSMYLRVEEKKDVTAGEVVDAVYRLIETGRDIKVPEHYRK